MALALIGLKEFYGWDGMIDDNRPVYPYAFGILFMIFNLTLRQYTISTLIVLFSPIKIFYYVGDVPLRVLLFVDVPFHVFTSG